MNKYVEIEEENISEAECIKNYLAGYGRANPSNLKSISVCQDWQAIAKKELEKRFESRRCKIIENLPDEELKAIARGDLNLSDLAEEVWKTL